MILYHGSNVIVSHPQLVHQNRFLDFGFGFYTTTNRAQAVAFADKVYRRRREGTRSVSVYELDEQLAFSECSVLILRVEKICSNLGRSQPTSACNGKGIFAG